MGNFAKYYYPTYTDPESMPDISRPSRFDPLYGFPNGRKERPLPQVTLEEMNSANLTERERDYCADKLMAFKKCKVEVGMLWTGYYCMGLKEDYHHCEWEDYMLRLKEYERERRLIARDRRLKSIS